MPKEKHFFIGQERDLLETGAPQDHIPSKNQKILLTLPLRGDDTILLVKKNKEDLFMEEPCIRVENLTKSFAGRTVVNGLSFSVRKGEVFALLGHNGAGKSTTIDLILGLESPNSGCAQILGVVAAKNRKKVFEQVGVQLQHTEYQSTITVEEACVEYASLGCYDNIIVPAITLIAITAICGTIAVKTFRWE